MVDKFTFFEMDNCPKWHVVYVRSRAEKKIKDELDFLGIENYLPLQRKLRQWSDRKKWVEVPVMSGYIFVFVDRKEYEKVLKVTGVVAYVRFENKPAVIRKEQINAMKILLKQQNLKIEVLDKPLKKGDKIEVIGGPLLGLKGEMVSAKGKNKVFVMIEQINISLTAWLNKDDITKVLDEC